MNSGGGEIPEVAVIASPDADPARRSRVIAMVCQLWCWLGPFAIVPLIVRRTIARSDPFLRQVTAEVLNLQLAAVGPLVVCFGAALANATWVAIVAWVLFAAVVGYGYVVGVIGAVQAHRGIAWRYPINLNIVEGN